MVSALINVLVSVVEAILKAKNDETINVEDVKKLMRAADMLADLAEDYKFRKTKP